MISSKTTSDITLIGTGIMSATLGMLIKILMPHLKINIYERLDDVAKESSNVLNNAGTGHSAYCELNYTPQQKDGSINIDKAIEIATQFQISKEFWSFLSAKKILPEQKKYLTSIPHMSLVFGDESISYLKKRYETLVQHPLFNDMKYSESIDQIMEWIPLVMKNRKGNDPIAVTKMNRGTDVNYGVLTKEMIQYLSKQEGVSINLLHNVKGLKKQSNGSWELKIKDTKIGKTIRHQSKFIFIGSGGNALTLLQKSGIKEAKGYAGFPVSGQFLICKNESLAEQHNAKVYGKALDGAPPMSVPHLDTRIINGKKQLLFGPFAGVSPKFLKHGSYWDWFLSFRLHNIWPMIMAGFHNFDLIKYLIGQVMLSPKDRINVLKTYMPEAKIEDWKLHIAGQRVQIMKKDKKQGGVLKLGTEIIHSEDRSLAVLLGASPGASTSVYAMIDVLERCFPNEIQSKETKTKIIEMIPSYKIK